MAEADLAPVPEPRRLPPVIPFDANRPMRFTPLEMRLLKQQTGRGFTQLMQDEPLVVQVWLTLRREGFPDLHYRELEACEIEVSEGEVPDPLSGPPPMDSPPFVGSGG